MPGQAVKALGEVNEEVQLLAFPPVSVTVSAWGVAGLLDLGGKIAQLGLFLQRFPEGPGRESPQLLGYLVNLPFSMPSARPASLTAPRAR